MSHQYAASYPSPRDAESAFSRLSAMLGGLVKGSKTKGSRRSSLLAIIRRRLLSLSTILVLVWIWLLHWGERSVFHAHIAACEWEQWEQWPAHATPHRVALVSDPQLVDPHTYPGRPWPLSALTVAFTDKYLKRSYRLLQRNLDPDTVFFLGDLFDGGREWATVAKGFQSSEKRWQKYGEPFWLQEYNRFGDIFFQPDQVSGGLPVTKAKKTIASLPGNHDLGFGNGIQQQVKDRFRAYFGESDRVDVFGNHTFVSLDTVSLSAMGQPDADESLWNATMRFLDDAQELKAKAVKQALHITQDTSMHAKYSHGVTRVDQVDKTLAKSKKAKLEGKPELPTIVLTHVPLYREPGTPCGPLRERSPPSAPNLEHDDANAIRVAAGYQYQNVLTHDISKLITTKVSNVGYVFSGDDHDYCELVHRAYPSGGSGIREVTVKSMSWAMGVRHPGFVMLSLWNPVDGDAKTLYDIQGGQKMGDATLQSHLCLLPDQLAIFIRYAIGAVFSLLILAVYAVVEARKAPAESTEDVDDSPLLPTFETKKRDDKPSWNEKRNRSRAASTSMNSSNSPDGSGASLSARSKTARTRPVSPMPMAVGGYTGPYTLPTFNKPLVDQAGYFGSKNYDVGDGETDDWGNPPMKVKPKKPKTFIGRIGDKFGEELLYVGGLVMVWYWWLLRSG